MRTTYPCRDGRETICGKAQNLQECGVVGRLPSALVTRVCTLCIHRKVMIDTCVLSHVWLFVTLWTVPCQAPLSMGFFWQEYWSGLPFPPLGHLPQPRDWTYVSCTGRQTLYYWVTREAHRVCTDNSIERHKFYSHVHSCLWPKSQLSKERTRVTDVTKSPVNSSFYKLAVFTESYHWAWWFECSMGHETLVSLDVHASLHPFELPH